MAYASVEPAKESSTAGTSSSKDADEAPKLLKITLYKLWRARQDSNLQLQA